MKKPKIGFYSFTCCEGCIVKAFQLEEKLVEVLGAVELVALRLLGKKDSGEKMDVAIVEGTPLSEKEIEELKEIRERSKFLVAFGSCATLGGVNALRNALPEELQKKLVEGVPYALDEKVKALNAFVKVDYEMQGCPIEEEELLRVLVALLHGIVPKPEQAPVCFECKIRENDCLLLKGIPCLGPITNCGCKAVCTSSGVPCIGCRGITEDANVEAFKKILEEKQVPEEMVEGMIAAFNSGGKKNA